LSFTPVFNRLSVSPLTGPHGVENLMSVFLGSACSTFEQEKEQGRFSRTFSSAGGESQTRLTPIKQVFPHSAVSAGIRRLSQPSSRMAMVTVLC
jgi:hypothetical protein